MTTLAEAMAIYDRLLVSLNTIYRCFDTTTNPPICHLVEDGLLYEDGIFLGQLLASYIDTLKERK